MRSPFVLDLDVIASNGRTIVDIVERRGFNLVAVLKHGFRSRQLIETLNASGIDAFAFAAPPPEGSPGRTMSLYPTASRLRRDWPAGTVFTELALDPIARLLTSSARVPDRAIEIMIPVLTSEGREGLDATDVPEFAASLERRFGKLVKVRGVQASFGCIEDSGPGQQELRGLHDLTLSLATQSSSPMVLSLGGSVVLPILGQVPVHPHVPVEIRCGEAIVAGTIPGYGPMFGLQPSATLIGNIIQIRPVSGALELVVDRGEYTISGKGTRIAIPGARIIRNSSQLSVVQCPESAVDSAISQVEFVLGYADTVTCLETRD